MMIKNQWIAILLMGLIINLCQGQQCTTKFDLDNILQDQIVMYPTFEDGIINQTQQYFYPRTFFTSTPKIITSIQSYQVSSFSEINYFLTTRVSRSFVDFTFVTISMNWTFVKIKFWLSARSDLLVGSFVLENISSTSQKSFDISIPAAFTPFVDEKSIQLNYISGLKASTSGDSYEIDVKNSGRSVDGSTFKVNVSCMGQTSIQRIQISYTIFNFESSYFASGGGQINYTPTSSSEFKKIHGSFAPIIYQIQGFDKLKLSKNVGLNLQFSVDLDLVLQTYAGNKFEELGVVYLSIGKQPTSVCSCDQYIMKGGCVDSCPAMTYPHVSYSKGGKSCLTCSPKLNQTMNEFSTGCICMQGLKRVGEYCIREVKTTECLAKNTVLSSGTCVCIAGTQLVKGNCESTCKTNEFYNSSSSQCECNFGYYYISGSCGVCSSDKVYSDTFLTCICPQFQYIADGGACKCVPTYYNYSGTCVSKCPAGYTKSNGNCIPSQNCSTNQVFQNGQCICVNNTYIINNTCATCPATTYYNSTSQTCINCLAHCAVCFNYTSCAECKQQFYYNQTSNQCLMNKTCTVNQTLTNGQCQCITGTYQINGACNVCLIGTFYNSDKKLCQNCATSCLQCDNATSCNHCLPNYNFNPSLGYCAPTCTANQTLLNGGCECKPNTYRINGFCTTCPSSQYYDNISKSCVPCISNCITCSYPQSCDKCMLTHYFSPVTKSCQPSNCPINQTIKDGRCDCVDGTYRISGGCGVCKPDQFYNSNLQYCKQCTDNCIKCSNQVMCAQCQPYFKLVNGECKFNLYNLKQGSPQFSQNIIVTEFESSEPSKAKKLSETDLKQLLFEKSNVLPGQTIIQQNPNKLSELRVIFSYCGYIPFDTYNITYTFNDPSISIKEDVQIVSYNVLEKGLTNYFP